MSLLWRPAMAIDNGIIDHDHQLLISIINDFCETKPRFDGTAELQRILVRLHHYINTHFAREEQLQAACNFPARLEHHAAHRELHDRLDMLSEQVAALDKMAKTSLPAVLEGDLAMIDHDVAQNYVDAHHELGLLLRHWVVEHILKNDLAMRPYAEAMKPHAAQMQSLWAVKPALLVPNLDTPQAAKQALASAKGWVHAGFRDEHHPLAEANGLEMLHPVPQEPAEIVHLRSEAKRIGMTIDFDSHCEHFVSPVLNSTLAAWRESRAIGPGSRHFSFVPSPMRSFLDSTALFQRVEQPDGTHRYVAARTGPKYARIFGAIAGRDLESFEPPAIFARWKLLLDGTLNFGAPLRVVGFAQAFGRDDLMVEGLLAPFHERGAKYAEVLGAVSYDLSFFE